MCCEEMLPRKVAYLLHGESVTVGLIDYPDIFIERKTEQGRRCLTRFKENRPNPVGACCGPAEQIGTSRCLLLRASHPMEPPFVWIPTTMPSHPRLLLQTKLTTGIPVHYTPLDRRAHARLPERSMQPILPPVLLSLLHAPARDRQPGELLMALITGFATELPAPLAGIDQ